MYEIASPDVNADMTGASYDIARTQSRNADLRACIADLIRGSGHADAAAGHDCIDKAGTVVRIRSVSGITVTLAEKAERRFHDLLPLRAGRVEFDRIRCGTLGFFEPELIHGASDAEIADTACMHCYHIPVSILPDQAEIRLTDIFVMPDRRPAAVGELYHALCNQEPVIAEVR